MKPFRIALALALATAVYAQLGGLGKLKEKIEQKKQKAKPVTDRAQKAADTFTPWSAQEEEAIGEASAAKMVAMFGLVDDPKLTRYVNLVGQAVAQFVERQLPYRFAILNTDIVGAYALPGGFIFITKGALSGMTNEAQLAGALGHEITHCSERHLEKEIRTKKTSAMAVEEAKTATRSSALISAKGDAYLNDMFHTSLSRDKEDAADEHGSELAVKAGYDPAGLLEFLKAMKVANEKPENQQIFGQLLSTHPSFDSRIAHLQASADREGGRGQTLEARFRAAVLR